MWEYFSVFAIFFLIRKRGDCLQLASLSPRSSLTYVARRIQAGAIPVLAATAVERCAPEGDGCAACRKRRVTLA